MPASPERPWHPNWRLETIAAACTVYVPPNLVGVPTSSRLAAPLGEEDVRGWVMHPRRFAAGDVISLGPGRREVAVVAWVVGGRLEFVRDGGRCHPAGSLVRVIGVLADGEDPAAYLARRRGGAHG